MAAVLILLALCIAVAACRGSPTPSADRSAFGPTATAEPVGVALTQPEVRTLDIEEFEFRNCESEEELVFMAASVAPVSATAFVAETATAVSSAERLPIPSALRMELETRLCNAYRDTYELAVAEGAGDEFVVPADRVIAFRVLWEERTFGGSISFALSGADCMADYSYTLLVPKRVGHRTMACTA